MACGGGAGTTPPAGPPYRGGELPAYPGAARWCDGSVAGEAGGGSAHITWEALTSPDPPDVVAPFYRESLGAGSGRSWRVEDDGTERTLEITGIDERPGVTSLECSDDEIPRDAQTILFFSSLRRGG